MTTHAIKTFRILAMLFMVALVCSVTISTISPASADYPSPTPRPPIMAPPPPILLTSDVKIKRVDFKNNIEVQRDIYEASVQSIEDVDKEKDTIEWKDDNTDGITNKNWPVAYTRGSQVTLDIELEVQLPRGATSTGVAVIRGEAPAQKLVFERIHPGLHNGTNSVKCLVSTGTLPNHVAFIEPMKITWTVDTTILFKRAAGTSNLSSG